MAAVTAAAIGAAATVASVAASATSKSGSKAPRAPRFDVSYQRGINTQIQQLPRMLESEAQAREQYDPRFLEQTLRQNERTAGETARQQLAIAGEYSPQLIEQNKELLTMADPFALDIRNDMGRQVRDELAAGAGLSDEDKRRVRGSTYESLVNRGVEEGGVGAVTEALAMLNEGERKYQQRLSNASSYLSQPNVAQLSGGLRMGYTPMPEPQSFRYFNPDVGQQAVRSSDQNYSTQADIYRTQAAQPNPWVQGLGMIGGAGLNIAANSGLFKKI